MPAADSDRAYRLVSYNILEGLRPVAPAGLERRKIDRDRAASARRVVDYLAPDILVLNEALFCRLHEGRKVDYGEFFEYPHHVAALYDDAWGNAILSRYPIADWREMRIYNRGGLVAELDLPTGRLAVASYHPHPRRYPENKALDYAALTRDLAGPALVCGDFNAISPDDDVDRDALIAAFEPFASPADEAVDRFLESGRAIFGKLSKLGFRDAVPPAGRRYSMPTDLINPDKASAMRIDHILANKGIEIESGMVFHSADTNRASDHHPVYLDFRLS